MATDSLRKTQPAVPEALFEGNRLDQPTFHRLYEQTPEKFKAELIGGIVRLPPPQVPYSHGRLHALAGTWLSEYAFSDVTPNVQSLGPTTIKLGSDSEPQPDICMRFRHGTSHVSDDYCVGPPELIVEVSELTENFDLVDKRNDYERHGVSEYLALVVPESRAVWFAREEDGEYAERTPTDGTLRSRVFPGLWLDAEALFQLDYKRVMAVLNEGLASVGKET